MKKLIITAILTLFVSTTGWAQTGSPAETLEHLRAIDALIHKAMLGLEPAPTAKIVSTDKEFQDALMEGGEIAIATGAKLSSTRFVTWKSKTTIIGNDAFLTGTAGPALFTPPGVTDIIVQNLFGAANYGAVFQCGSNDGTQTLASQQPRRISYINVTVPSHHGPFAKRGFELDCAEVTLTNPIVLDTYSGNVNPQDSQGIAIINSCGPVTVTGGNLQGGSENMIIGGDRLQITDCPEGVAADISFRGTTFEKPLAWRTMTMRVAPKNVVELKAGKRVTISKSIIRHSFRAISTAVAGATQDGSCIVITPKNAQYIETVLFEDNIIEHCAQGMQLMGKDYNSVTPKATSGVVFRGNTWTIDGPTYNGRGVFATLSGGMPEVVFENETIIMTGTSLFLMDSGEPVGPMIMRNSKVTAGRLVCAAPGVNYCDATPVGRVPLTVQFEGNTMADAPSRFKTLYPNNTFVTRAQLDALLIVPGGN